MNRGWSIVVLAAAGVLALALLPPVVNPAARMWLMTGFSAVCHQLPDRSLHVHGIALAVCSRCIGIYAGLLVGGLTMPFVARWDTWLWRRNTLLLVVAVVVPAIDWLAGILSVWESGHVTRLLTGAAFGLISGYFLARAASRISAAPSAASA